MPSLFICDALEIKSKIRTLEYAGQSKDNADNFYIDPKTREPWILTTYESDYLNCMIQVLTNTEISTEELIEICLTSNDLNKVSASVMELEYREKHRREDFRAILIGKLLERDLKSLSVFEKERIKTIIYDSNLHNGTNQKSIIGKNWTEIQKDTALYNVPANSAKEILKVIDE